MARQLNHSLVNTKISFKRERVNDGSVEGPGRSERLAQWSEAEAGSRGDDGEETHDDAVWCRQSEGRSIDWERGVEWTDRRRKWTGVDDIKGGR
jgi:hypothetical protein